MEDTKGRTIEGSEAEQSTGTAKETEEELKESIRLNTFRIYSLQEMQRQLQKELRRAITNGADEKTISAIQKEWDRNVRDYRETVIRIQKDMERVRDTGKESAKEAAHEADPFSAFNAKDIRKYLEARTRAIRAALGKLIKVLRAKNEQRESEREAAGKETARSIKAKAAEFTADLKEGASRISAAYFTILAAMEKTFEKHLDAQIEWMKKRQQAWEAVKKSMDASKAAGDPQDLDREVPPATDVTEGDEFDNPKVDPEPSADPEITHQSDPAPSPTPESESKIEEEPMPEQGMETVPESKQEVPKTHPEPVPMPEPVSEPASEPIPESVSEPASEPIPEPVPEPAFEPQPQPEESVVDGQPVSDASNSTESVTLTDEDLARLTQAMMLNGMKDNAEQNWAEYTGRADESSDAAKDAAKEAEEAKLEAERIAEQEKVDQLHGLTIDEAEKKILASLREQEELGDSKQVIYQDFDRDGDGKMDTRFSIVPNSYQQWNYDNILKNLQVRKANGEKTAGIDVNDKRYVNSIDKDEPIDLAITKATKRAADAKKNMETAAIDPDLNDDKNYSYFISVEDLSVGKDGRVHGGSRNVQFGDAGFAHETASNEEVRSGLFKKLKEYIQTLSKEGKMFVEKDQVWQEDHPILAAARTKLAKSASKGAKSMGSKYIQAFEDGAR